MVYVAVGLVVSLVLFLGALLMLWGAHQKRKGRPKPVDYDFMLSEITRQVGFAFFS